HIGQQLAHLGIKNIVVYDFDKIEESNLNRLVGAKFKDIKNASLKIAIAKRTIEDINPSVQLVVIDKKWQEQPEELQQCDVIIGCVDGLSERQQLEAECR